MNAPTSDVTVPCEAFGSLSDPLRWEIVSLLSTGERCVCDLEGLLGLTQSRLSYHLGVLRNAGLLTARKEGRWVYYSVAPDTFAALAAILGRVADESRFAPAAPASGSCT